MIDLSMYADLELWAVDKPVSSDQAINLNGRVEFELTEFGAQAWEYPGPRPKPGPMTEQLWVLMRALGASMSNGGRNAIEGNTIRPVGHAGRPSHRAYTLTAGTLALARNAAALCRSEGNSVGRDLLDALKHAEGVPEPDLCRLALWVRERCSDLELVGIADSVLANLAIDAMPEGSVEVRKKSVTELNVGVDYASGPDRTGETMVDTRSVAEKRLATLLDEQKHLITALRRQADLIASPMSPPAIQAARLLNDYADGLKVARQAHANALERAESAEAELKIMRPLHEGMREALAVIESIVCGSGKPPSEMQEVESIVAAVREYERTVMRHLIEHERVANRAARSEAIVGATESLVRRLSEHMREVDPDWTEELRRGGS